MPTLYCDGYAACIVRFTIAGEAIQRVVGKDELQDITAQPLHGLRIGKDALSFCYRVAGGYCFHHAVFLTTSTLQSRQETEGLQVRGIAAVGT